LKVSGSEIIKILRQRCEDTGVKLLLSCPAEKILTDDKGRVNGVRAEMDGKTVEINAGSVIIATGGYIGNKELLKKYYPAYSDRIVFLGMPHTGDGYRMATEIGAATEGLGVLLLHPHIYRGSVQIDALAQEPATVWVNKQGNRFTDETVTFRPTECGNTINRQLDKCVCVLLDSKLKQKIEEEGFIRGAVHGGTRGTHIPTGVRLAGLGPVLQSEAAKGEVKISDSWEDIAAWIGVSSEVLKATIDSYNQSCDRGYDEVFNKERSYLQALRTPPYYAIRCYLSCLDTIGGIKINHRMEVLDILDNPIPGLYAGGDAAGGWETSTYCIRLPGSALGFAINSGRIAAENAVNFIG
jgi:fumarate reductase flavoprotein subunit